MMKRPSIPALTQFPPTDPAVYSSIKENIEIITGRRGTKIAKLKDTASTADIINKVNEIVDLLQA
jgi:hypothetical protein